MKYGQGQQVFRVGVADQDNVLARFVGGDESVLSGLMMGADALRSAPSRWTCRKPTTARAA